MLSVFVIKAGLETKCVPKFEIQAAGKTDFVTLVQNGKTPSYVTCNGIYTVVALRRRFMVTYCKFNHGVCCFFQITFMV
jgi:hypothetical protein